MRGGKALGVLLFLLFLSSLGPARAGAKTDWILVKALVGPRVGDTLVMKVSGTVKPTGKGPLVFGQAYAGPHGGFVDLFSVGGDGLHVRSTRDAGSLDVEILPGEAGSFRFQGRFQTDTVDPGERIAWLTFFTNSVVEKVKVKHGLLEGDAAFAESMGNGSKAIPVAGPQVEGAAVAAGPVAAGTASASATVGRGLVGAFDPLCQTCRGSWRAPGGRSGDWSFTYVSAVVIGFADAEGGISFAGPAGKWAWDWTGVRPPLDPFFVLFFEAGTPVMVAYAPIGDDWKLFEGAAAGGEVPL
jgi:hypothetical protein